MEEGTDSLLADEELQSQRDLNENMIREGDVEVQYAPVLPCLTVPDRKAALYRAFKLPEGCVKDEGAPRKTLGARRRRKVAIPGFMAHRPMDAIAEELEQDPGAAEAEPAPPAVVIVASAVAAEGTYEPLVLYDPAAAAAAAITAATTATAEGEAPAPEPGATRVEVEGLLCKHLREHQREGVQFMFDCIHGLKPFNGQGCILADDMGLGKTLQSITLLYTVLRQGMRGTPTVRRVIVVCPTSLVNNWAKEIAKWVGDRIKPLPIAEASRDKAIMDINTFLNTRVYPVLIISYETFRIHAARFHARADACDLLICDEAHRLKNERTLTTQALSGLACRRRILLSGTPMQNDLEEFFAMVDFTNPGVLGDAAHFRKKYESPILAAREPWATDRQKALAEETSTELSNIVNQFILRRTNTLLSKHLPPKLMQIVCVKMAPLQQQLYEHFLSSKELSLIMSGKQSGVLSSITALRKLVNHPKLIYDAVKANERGNTRKDESAAGFEDCEKFFPEQFHRERSACAEMSGKFALTARMLTMLRHTTSDRIVIVSCYTQTLDLFSALCREHSWPSIRLDGSTAAGKRQKLVDRFNDPKADEFVFLLSSRAGGCGLNLIGGNRLILFDPDWNPATDLQAAARVWRDGQRKKVYVYRFLAAGTLEEKVFQRQLSKKGLQTIVVEEGDEVNSLSSDDLRNLFSSLNDTASDTHDMLRCMRCREAELEEGASEDELEAQRAEERAKLAELGAAAAAAAAACASSPSDVSMGMEVDDPAGIDSFKKMRVAGSNTSGGGGGHAPEHQSARNGCITDDSDVDGDTSVGTSHAGNPSSPAHDVAVIAIPDSSEDQLLVDEALARALAAEFEEEEGAEGGGGESRGGEGEEAEIEHGSSSDGDGGGKGRKGRGKAAAKRKRGRPPAKAKAKGPSKAAQRREAKAAALEQKALDAARQAAVKESLSKPLPAVEAGTHRRQIKWPQEDDLKSWSHHHGCATVADDVLRETGQGLVTFVFGCEVRGRDPSEFAPPPAAAPAASRGLRAGFVTPTASSGATKSATAAAGMSPAPAMGAGGGGALGRKRLGPLKIRRPGANTAGISTPSRSGFKVPTFTGTAALAQPLQRAKGRAKAAKPVRRKKAGSESEEQEEEEESAAESVAEGEDEDEDEGGSTEPESQNDAGSMPPPPRREPAKAKAIRMGQDITNITRQEPTIPLKSAFDAFLTGATLE